MPTRPKYPNARGAANKADEKQADASSKETLYNDLADTLKTCKDNVSSEIRTAKGFGTTTSTAVDGDYYDRYITKRDDWIILHGEIITKFDNFASQLDTCIENARNKASEYRAEALKWKSEADMWRSRIGIMEEY